MSKPFIIWFLVCFVCYAMRTTYNILNFRNHPLAERRHVITAVYIIMFVLWFSWAQMCFTDSARMKLPAGLKYAGLGLFIAGVFLFIFSHLKLKKFKEDTHLVKEGIYSKIRNPMYTGFIIWIIGFPVFFDKRYAFLSSVLWITHILIWKHLEERTLEKKYPEYKAYKKATWF